MRAVIGTADAIKPIIQELNSEFPNEICMISGLNSPKQTLISGGQQIVNEVSIAISTIL